MSVAHLPSSPRRTIQAASRRLRTSRVTTNVPSEQWQSEAWEMYDQVGELRFVANSHANSLSQARLFAAVADRGDSEPVPVDVDDPEIDLGALVAARTVAAWGGGVLRRADLIRRIGLNLFVAGDVYLLGVPKGTLDGHTTDGIPPQGLTADQLEWHALSTIEVAADAKHVTVKRGEEQIKVSADEAILIRVWRAHPRRWWQADSPVRANLGVLRELVGLTKHVAASIDSRLAGAGILWVPDEVAVAAASGGEDAGIPQGSQTPADAVMQELIDVMQTAIRDRDSAAALVPLVLTAPGEHLANVQHMSLATPFDDRSKDLRDEAIRRLALGLDAPAETLLGMGGANHWSAWQIEESTVKVHIEPVLALLADALTSEYLWPTLETMRVDDPARYAVWYSTSELTLRPNRVGDATSLYQLGELSGDTLRREAGFGPDDAPPQVDRAVEIALAAVGAAPSLIPDLGTIVTTLRELLAGGGPEPGAGGTVDLDRPADGPPDTQGAPPVLDPSP